MTASQRQFAALPDAEQLELMRDYLLHDNGWRQHLAALFPPPLSAQPDDVSYDERDVARLKREVA